MVELYANAKINLALEVMEEKDGYHQVNNIMIPINIYDTKSAGAESYRLLAEEVIERE